VGCGGLPLKISTKLEGLDTRIKGTPIEARLIVLGMLCNHASLKRFTSKIVDSLGEMSVKTRLFASLMLSITMLCGTFALIRMSLTRFPRPYRIIARSCSPMTGVLASLAPSNLRIFG
jgi:hypothetical protein